MPAHTIRHILKTAIATTLAALIYVIFRIPAGYWIAVSTLIVMQSGIETGSIESSLRASRDRIFGTLVGSVVGIGGAFLTTLDIWWVVPALAASVLLCSYLTAHFPSLRLATLTAVLIMLIGAFEPEAWLVAFQRSGSILAGCVIAAAANLLLWPYRAKDHLLQGFGHAGDLFATYYHQITANTNPTATKQTLESTLFKNKRTARDLGTALGLSRDRFEAYYTALQLQTEIYDELKIIERASGGAPHLIKQPEFTLQNVADLMFEALSALPALFSKTGKGLVHLLDESLSRLEQSIEAFRKEQKALDHTLPFHELADFFSFLYGTRRLAALIRDLEEVALRCD